MVRLDHSILSVDIVLPASVCIVNVFARAIFGQRMSRCCRLAHSQPCCAGRAARSSTHRNNESMPDVARVVLIIIISSARAGKND